MYDIFLLRISANSQKIGHPIKNTWFHPKVGFQSMFAEMNNALDASPTRAMWNKRKALFQQKLFRGHPREIAPSIDERTILK